MKTGTEKEVVCCGCGAGLAAFCKSCSDGRKQGEAERIEDIGYIEDLCGVSFFDEVYEDARPW